MKTREEIIQEMNTLITEQRQKYIELIKLETKIETLQGLIAEQKPELVN